VWALAVEIRVTRGCSAGGSVGVNQNDYGSDRALLVAFGDLFDRTGAIVRGRAILTALLGSGVWLTTRVPKAAVPPIAAAFYQTGIGVVACARVVGLRPTTSLVRVPLPDLPLKMFPTALDLDSVRLFERPVDVRSVLDQLSFIHNKKQWGQAFRYTPRMIPKSDYDALIRQSEYPN